MVERDTVTVRQEQLASQQSQGQHPAGTREKEVSLGRIKGCSEEKNSSYTRHAPTSVFLETVIVFKFFCGQHKGLGKREERPIKERKRNLSQDGDDVMFHSSKLGLKRWLLGKSRLLLFQRTHMVPALTLGSSTTACNCSCRAPNAL